MLVKLHLLKEKLLTPELFTKILNIIILTGEKVHFSNDETSDLIK